MLPTSVFRTACRRLGGPRRWLALLAGLLSLQNVAGAQRVAAPSSDSGWVRESWTARDGLPVNSINDLLQSRDGYIWAATFDGLVRFDGVRFTVFNTANTPGLPSNRIIELVEAPDGALWMWTEQGRVARFAKGRAEVIAAADGTPFIAATFGMDSSSGTLWVATDRGLGRVRDRQIVFVARDSITGSATGVLPAGDGTVYASDDRGRLWRHTADGVTRRIPLVGGAPVQTMLSAKTTIYRDPSGVIWFGGAGGIWSGRDTLRAVPVPLASPTAQKFTYDAVYAFQRSAATGVLWVYGRLGIYRERSGKLELQFPQNRVRPTAAMLNDTSGVWFAAANRIYREGSLMHRLPESVSGILDPTEVTVMLADREGSIWLGTQSTGLQRLTRSLFRAYGMPEGGSSNNIYPIAEDRAGGAMWLGTWGFGITRVDTRTNRVTNFGPEFGLPTFTQSLLPDGPGRLLVSGDRGLRSCITTPVFRCTSLTDAGIDAASVTALYADERGAVWAASDRGIFRRDGAQWTVVPGAPSAIGRAFARTQDGALWIATNGGGLLRWADGRFARVTAADGLPTDVIRSLYVDPAGWLWVGTEGRGLVRIDPRTWGTPRSRRIVTIGTEHGLYDDVVHQILNDDDGRLWMSSNRGIFRVSLAQLQSFADGRTSRIVSVAYTERDGLRNREANGGFFPAGVRASDGRLWFPTQAGAVVVDPTRVARKLVPPPVVIERVLTRDSTRVATAAPMILTPPERDLEVQYTAPSFVEAANLRFRYRLEPYDADWVDASTRRSAFYTRVPPGQYTFRVSVADAQGVWHDTDTGLALTLTPHWYETGAARTLAAVLGALLIALAVRWRLDQVRAQALELESTVAARTLELRKSQSELAERNTQLAEQAATLAALSGARSRLFANLSHEFRTPLTLILGPLQGLLEGRYGPISDKATEQATLMRRNAQRLLRLINQVLDLARLQSGSMTLDLRAHDAVVLTRGAVDAFRELAERRNVALQFTSSVAALPTMMDVSQIEKVLLNLLSNALKFTPEGGAVEVQLTQHGSAAVITVRDTGVGISAEDLPRIFERFYQADSSIARRYEGSGIGLALARELVELHGGSISAKSTPGEGSTFTVRLPLGGARAEDIRPSGEKLALNPRALSGARAAVTEAVVPSTSASVPEPTAAPMDEDAADQTTVLVVDDNADVRAYLRAVLEPKYRVLDAGNGREGLDLAQQHLPDIVLADIMMPEMDGLAMSTALRADPMLATVPLVMLTARADSETHAAGYEAGADAYLTKPFEPAVLEACVAGLLTQRRRLRERYAQAAAEVAPTVAADDASTDASESSAPEAERAVSARTAQLRSIVLSRLLDPTLTPAALAEASEISYHQLYRHLQTEMNWSPSRFIRSVRAERAAELLAAGEGTVTEVAYAVGFESLSYFGRAFRERFGVNAATYLPDELG